MSEVRALDARVGVVRRSIRPAHVVPVGLRASCRNCVSLKICDDGFVCAAGLAVADSVLRHFEGRAACAEFSRPHIEPGNSGNLAALKAHLAKVDAMAGVVRKPVSPPAPVADSPSPRSGLPPAEIAVLPVPKPRAPRRRRASPGMVIDNAAELLSALKGTATHAEIGNDFGLTRQRVSKIAAHFVAQGVLAPRKRGGFSGPADVNIGRGKSTDIMARLLRHEGVADIAAAVGCHPSNVSMIKRRMRDRGELPETNMPRLSRHRASLLVFLDRSGVATAAQVASARGCTLRVAQNLLINVRTSTGWVDRADARGAWQLTAAGREMSALVGAGKVILYGKAPAAGAEDAGGAS